VDGPLRHLDGSASADVDQPDLVAPDLAVHDGRVVLLLLTFLPVGGLGLARQKGQRPAVRRPGELVYASLNRRGEPRLTSFRPDQPDLMALLARLGRPIVRFAGRARRQKSDQPTVRAPAGVRVRFRRAGEGDRLGSGVAARCCPGARRRRVPSTLHRGRRHRPRQGGEVKIGVEGVFVVVRLRDDEGDPPPVGGDLRVGQVAESQDVVQGPRLRPRTRDRGIGPDSGEGECEKGQGGGPAPRRAGCQHRNRVSRGLCLAAHAFYVKRPFRRK
jgi:hypothetical protein